MVLLIVTGVLVAGASLYALAAVQQTRTSNAFIAYHGGLEQDTAKRALPHKAWDVKEARTCRSWRRWFLLQLASVATIAAAVGVGTGRLSSLLGSVLGSDGGPTVDVVTGILCALGVLIYWVMSPGRDYLDDRE